VLGLDGLQGLQVGQQADIALYRLDDPRYFGLHDPAIGPVASGGRPFLKAMWVGGRAVVLDDAIPGVDLAELGAQARQAVKKMLEGN
jgi:cytosine/adenosine deaminase-related metal-dependent hydrolase